MSTHVGFLRQPLWTGLLAATLMTSGVFAQDSVPAGWQVSKSTGDVWVTSTSVQPAALTRESALNPGDSIRTGRNGRVLITRGNETIFVAPNSEVAIPATQKDAASTTVIQRAGSILLDVEKRNVKHFEVETPYLVAVVKGTQFTVSVGANEARVNVTRGEVEVADFKSGQVASILPGQTATSRGAGGLSLSGAGVLGPVRQGTPRTPTVSRVPVPRNGLTAPRAPGEQHVRALRTTGDGVVAEGGRGHGLRIGATLGEVKIDVQKASHGLAREAKAAPGSQVGRTVWSSGDILPGNGVGKSYNAGNNGSGTGAGSTNGSGGGNGNAGGNGNGNAYGVAKGNAGGDGNGNGNAYGLNGGNGHGRGHGRH